MERKVYIRDLSQISLLHPDPDYSRMFNVMEARRLSRLMKRSLAVSRRVLEEAGIDVPDAVITGTGLGCIENTELFLQSLLGLSDTPLRPTHFMQSTHNTIGSLIAIRLKCHGYNATYSQLGISFESALLDAWVQIRSGALDNALVGAFEEMTPDFARILEKAGYTGIIQPDGRLSETAVSMLLSASPEGALCELASVRLGKAACIGSGPASAVLTRADYVPRYGDNFSVSALGACDAVTALSGGRCESVLLKNDFYGKCFADVLFKRV